MTSGAHQPGAALRTSSRDHGAITTASGALSTLIGPPLPPATDGQSSRLSIDIAARHLVLLQFPPSINDPKPGGKELQLHEGRAGIRRVTAGAGSCPT